MVDVAELAHRDVAGHDVAADLDGIDDVRPGELEASLVEESVKLAASIGLSDVFADATYVGKSRGPLHVDASPEPLAN